MTEDAPIVPREIYVLATRQARPLDLAPLRELFAAEDVTFEESVEGCLFRVVAEQTRVDVRFEAIEGGFPNRELYTGSDAGKKLLAEARGFYGIAFEPGRPQPSVAVFEALWCVRSMLENVEGVVVDLSSYKIHESEDITEITELDFDIRDHITLHAVEAAQTETPVWVHTHGMDKFSARDVEIFHLGEDDLEPAETFLHELCTDLAFGQGPEPRAPVETSEGAKFILLPSEEGRLNLFGVASDVFEGHESQFLTVVAPDGRHNIADLLRPYRDRFEEESDEETTQLLHQAQALLPAFKARFLRKGFMEPLGFLVRVPFESHPEGQTKEEKLWVEVLSWEEGSVIGKLVDGGRLTTEWRKGAHVELTEDQVNALAVTRGGRQLQGEELASLLLAERPA